MGSNVDAAAAISSERTSSEEIFIQKKPRVVFVLGGPGGGKSTQCSKIAKEIGYTHLSSGQLLREASKLDPENGSMIDSRMKEGLSVPADYTMKIIEKAINESENDKFLLDGFPRDEEIRSAFEAAFSVEPELVLYFDCSEKERERRIFIRNQGRVDDNSESIKKKFKYFEEHTVPVVEYYNSRGKVTKIDASKPMEEVYAIVKSCLTSPKVHSENVTEQAESLKELESKTSTGVAAVNHEVVFETVTEDESKSSAQSEVVDETVTEDESKSSTQYEVVVETVTKDESKSSTQSEVLSAAEEAVTEVASQFDLERDIMKMKL